MKIKIFSLLLFLATLATGWTFVTALRMFVSLFEASRAAVVVDSPRSLELRSVQLPHLPPKPELSCYDFNILPIWNELKRDTKFRKALKMFPGKADCSEMLKVERASLDGDKFDEFIVWGKDTQRFCGATGNCDVWVFDVANGRVSKVLSSGGVNFEVEKSTSRGFRNLVVRFNGSSYPDSLFDYKFNGHEYRLAKCYQQDKQTLEKWDESCEDWEDTLAGITP